MALSTYIGKFASLKDEFLPMISLISSTKDQQTQKLNKHKLISLSGVNLYRAPFFT